MAMDNMYSILMAVTAYTCISIGFVFMKKGIGWIGWKGKKELKYFRSVVLWVFGFIIMNIYALPSAIALKKLPSHIVASFAGWGIIVLVFLSYFILKEKLFYTDYLYSSLIVLGIIMLNVYEKKDIANNIANNIVNKANIFWMILLTTIPLVLFISGFFNNLSAKIKTVIFAAVSGISAGLMVVYLGLLIQNFGNKIIEYPKSPYLFLYMLFALLSFFSLQIAMKKGEMIIIGPVQYSMNIIYPVFASLLLFDIKFVIQQYLAITLIVYSISGILKRH